MTNKITEAQDFCDRFNADYEAKHEAFEAQFWGTKMNLSGNFSASLLSQTKAEMEGLLSDASMLQQAHSLRRQISEENVGSMADETLIKTLDVIIRTCKCYQMPSAAKEIRERTSHLESQLEEDRNHMKLGYADPATGKFVERSSVGLRTAMRTSEDENTRKAAYEGLRSIGPFVLDHGFCEIVKLRNRLAKHLGFIDYYDYKVTNAEGFGKDKLFEMLDGLEKGTRPIVLSAREEMTRRFGPNALEPWNQGFMMSGDVVKKMDPYFQFSKAVEQYLKSYARLGISYRGAVMNLDLLERPKKHSNGFCHWPKVAWNKHGMFLPSVANFTSLADPQAVGSGHTALTTLMHEAGHAAHFANIDQPSPLFGQERAPTSVAYAENQSMFLDSLVGDAAWRAKYAIDSNGKPMPFSLIEEEIRSSHPFAVFQLRAMLSVSYFEKALYEMTEEQVTPEEITSLADKVEMEVQGGFSPRPLLSVPHLISDEASCYYHGYTLAECSVHQTRQFFLERDGFLVDNPKIGPDLTDAYWKHGNSRAFLDLVQDLTKKPLSGDAWIAGLQENVDDKVSREKSEYEKAIAAPSARNDSFDDVLNMTIRFVDGDTLIADSSQTEGGIMGACQDFSTFVEARALGSM